MGVAAQNVVFTPLALVAAVAAAVLGRRFAAGHYLEDQLLTDRRAVVVPRIGAAYGLRLGDIRERRVARHAEPCSPVAAESCASASCAGTGRSARRSRRARRTSRSSSARTELRRLRLALVAAPCARMAIAALTAACFLPAAASAADLRPCAGGARCGSVTVPLVAADPAAGSVNVGFEVYAHKRAGKARDTILVSAGSDGVPTTAGRAALLALLDPLRDRRDVVLVDARGTGRSGRVGPRRDAYGEGASAGDLDAVRGGARNRPRGAVRSR